MSFSQEFSYQTCPWCNTQDVSLKIAHETYHATVAKGGNREWTWLFCPRCGGAISIETTLSGAVMMRTVPEQYQSAYRVEHLPTDVEEYFDNAQRVLNAGVESSAAVELRRTLEAAAKHQGIDEDTLVHSIEKLAEKGLITNNFVEVMRHIRKIGNAGAHAGDESLSAEDVQKALTFTTQVLRNLFEIPQELKSLEETGPHPEDSEDSDQVAA